MIFANNRMAFNCHHMNRVLKCDNPAIAGLLQILKSRYRYVIFSIVLLFWLWPSRYATRYTSIPRDHILDEVVQKTTANISQLRGVQCEYGDLLAANEYLHKPPYTVEILDEANIRQGGEYYPEDCTPKFSTAIIVPYRQRETQLNAFLIYIHNFLRRQRIHYRIFIIEQAEFGKFNRAKLFNVGAMMARNFDYPCIVLHDVDLFPMHVGNLYTCTKQPRHMSASIDKFRFNLPYHSLFGGAVSIETDSFFFVNGMSNIFFGWGGEDDDLFERLDAKKLAICRFEPAYSRYVMIMHKYETPNPDRVALYQSGRLRIDTDGLNTLLYEEKSFKLHKLFTHVLVRI